MAKKYQGHYNCKKLISTLDAEGQKPTYYVVVSDDSNRGAGKTFGFSKLLVDHFMDNGEKMILICRHKGDLGSIASGVLNSYIAYAHPDWSVSETIQSKSTYSKITITIGAGKDAKKMDCGYVIPLRSASEIKNISSHFYDTWAIFFDEFQPLDGMYLRDEPGLLRSIYKSVARGDGHATRYMPIFMSSNTLQFGNPYFKALSLTKAIQRNTRFYRGIGVVFENCEVDGLAEEHAATGIDRAMAGYLESRGDNMWMLDNETLVTKPNNWGHGRYVATIVYNGEYMGVYSYDQVGYTYVSRQCDKSCKYVYNLTLEGNLNLPAIKISGLLETLRNRLLAGLVRVSDSGIQSILIDVFG